MSKHMQKHAEKPNDKRLKSAVNRQMAAMNAAAAAAAAIATNGALTTTENPYWPKVSPDSAANLAEAMQQQQHQQNQYDFALSQQHANGEHAHHRALIEHHRNLNGNAGSGGGGGGNDDGGEDLVISRQNATNLAQHLIQQNQAASAQNVSSGIGGYDAASITKTTSSSAFTPINTMPHLNTLGHHPMAQRPYLYDAINFQSKNVNQNMQAAFPNQLISLHQIRNYAHQPGPGGMIPGEHLLGIGVGAGLKDKAQ